MKSIILSLIFILGYAVTANAQSTQRAEISVGSSDKSYTDFFRRHPTVNSIDIDYTNNRTTLKINKKESHQSDNRYQEIFVLTFEGDEYLFKKKYGEIKIPSVFNVRFSYINGVSNADLQKSPLDMD